MSVALFLLVLGLILLVSAVALTSFLLLGLGAIVSLAAYLTGAYNN
jgi:hypothetical protein